MQKVGELGRTLMLSGGVLVILLGISLCKAEADFKSRAILASGTITEAKLGQRFVTSTYGGYNVTYISATVRFQIRQGDYIQFVDEYICEKHILTSIESDISACIGKNVVVLYDPENPKKARASS